MNRLSLAAMAAVACMSTNAFAGTSTFSGAINGAIDLSIVATDGPAANSATVLENAIHVPGSKKDLLIGVSIQSGVITDTKIKGKDGMMDVSTASGSVDITVYLDGNEIVAPGTVTFNHRRQTLDATLSGFDSCEDANGDGLIDFDLECTLTEEEIGLLLETTSANHFNFIAPNVGPGEHALEVVADVSAAAESEAGSAQGEAIVNVGSLTVEVVRSANTEDGITIE